MALESKAFFTSLLVKYQLEPLQAKFTELGWDTLGAFAFAASYSATLASEEAMVTNLVEPLTGARVSRHTALIRRLFFLAYSKAANEMKA